MPSHPRLSLPIVAGAVLVAPTMLLAGSLGAPAWHGLATLPLMATACWSLDRWREWRMRRAVVAFLMAPASPASAFAPAHGLLEDAPVGLWEVDDEGRTLFANRQLARLFGGEAPVSLAVSGVAWPEEGALAAVGEGGAVLSLPGKPDRRLLVTASPWSGDGLGRRMLSVLDVTRFPAGRPSREVPPGQDPLTGLANRAALQAGLAEMAIDPGGGLLLLIDLDHFKSANERHGHDAGDALLREAARRLREAVRPSDLVSRLSGDKFAILVFGAQAEAAEEIAGRVREALAPRAAIEGAELSLAASIGIARAPEHGLDGEALLRAALLALREAKAQGRNTVVLFEARLRDRSERRAALREALAEALEAGELVLHLQPQQDLQAQRMVGAEALIRWNSRRLGRWIPPGEMLPAASEAGLMPALDRFVLREAVRMIAGWGDRPDAPRVLGINISVTTLRDPAFAEEVAAALILAGVAPSRLEIEIPENLAIRDLPGVARTLAALRELGVPLALDDFGGGHSGLPHVVRLPVQRLKLDRSIVAGLPDPKSYAVLRATVTLARAMGIEVVGEGVETQSQAFALRRAGCNIIQGYLIARPMPMVELVPPLPEQGAVSRQARA
nr:sensor domain-containing phosphodiesterase [uncultured Roseococcus sp.]